jgi:NAD(P)-dependent dehydrogenase (short-subunit alcohol dehydrogenase family)
MINFSGKVAIVTGAASGMGEATATTFAAHGAQVVIADINEPGAKAVADRITADGGTALAVPTDVRDEAQIEALIATTRAAFGRLDVLHNNAAAMELAGRDFGILEQTAQIWDETMTTDVRGPMLGCKYAIPLMLESGGGAIVNTTSISGQVGEAVMTAYGAAKAALGQLTRAVAAQWGKSGIRCNAVAPGLVLTPSGLGLPMELREIYLRQTLTPYLGEAQDVANLVVFLSSDDARYITAQVINIDGGLISHNGFVPDFLAWAKANAETE